MHTSRIPFGLAAATALLAFGCTSPRWSPPEPSEAWSHGGPHPPQAASPSPPAPAYPAATSGTPVQASPEALQEVIAEVQRLQALDPEAEKRLLDNLRQTRPELWPLVLEQFRSTLAYRQQSTPTPPSPAPSADKPPGPATSGAAPASPQSVANPPPGGKAVLAKIDSPKAERATDDVTSRQLAGVPAASAGDARVIQAAYEPPSDDAWQARLDEATRLLESKVADVPESSDEIAEHARLRMLYLLAGRRDAALRPIPAVAPDTQDFWSNELHGLAALLDGASSAAPSRLAEEAHRPLHDAVTRLGESCPLALHNLSFVTEVQSYGVFERFEKYEFSPNHKLLLYAEVENFKSIETPQGFHTTLRSSYQIFDAAGRQVAEHQFETNEEYCRNRRRDFFIGYEFHLPTQIYPGRHVLKLTVEDAGSGKVGQSSVEFIVLGSDD